MTGGGFGTPPTETTTTRYDGECDIQDMSAQVRRNLFGDAWQDGVATVYFPIATFPSAVEVDDDFSGTYEGVTQEGKVIDFSRLSCSITVAWL